MEEKHFGPVWFIPGKNKGRYPYCHSIYIEGSGILIDPSSDRKRLLELRKNPGVNEVWLSHWHEDHIMHLDLFDDLPLSISEFDATPLSDLELFMDAYGLGDEPFRDYWRPVLKEEFNFHSRKPTKILKKGNSIDLGTVSVDIIHTPGHTPGHMSFFFRGPNVLTIGDYDLGPFGPWYGDVESDIDKTIDSVERLRKIPASVWIASHNEGIFETDPKELWDQYLHVIDQREKKLVDFLKIPRTIEDIIKARFVYKKHREPLGFYEVGERGIMGKHLKRLILNGQVAEESDRFYKIS